MYLNWLFKWIVLFSVITVSKYVRNKYANVSPLRVQQPGSLHSICSKTVVATNLPC